MKGLGGHHDLTNGGKAYIQTGDFESLKKVNTDLLDVAVRAIEKVAPKLVTVILQTGGKGLVSYISTHMFHCCSQIS